jgi:hypothetical protein
VPKAESGWQEDGISGGEMVLIMNGDEPDLVFTDVTQQTFSARGVGAAVAEVRGDFKDFRLIVVIYPAGAVEHFIFRLDGRGVGKVIWGTAKVGGPIQKSTIFEASCRQP